MTFISKSLTLTKQDSKFLWLNLSLLILSIILPLLSIFQESHFLTLTNLLTSKSQENQLTPLYSQPMTKTSFSVNYILKSELKSILHTFMVWDKDSSQISKRLLENGPYSQEIVLNKLIMELEDKHMDFIHFIFWGKNKVLSILIISETQMLWMSS